MAIGRPGDVQVMQPVTLPAHALSPIHSTMPAPAPHEPPPQKDKPELSRSASFTYLSGFSREGASSIKRTFSDNVLSFPPSRNAKVSEDGKQANKELFRRASKKTKKRLSGAQFTLAAEDDDEEDGRTSRATTDAQDSRGLSRSVTGTIRSLARKSWIPTSRSSSPANNSDEALEKKKSWSPAKKAATLAANSITVPKPTASRSPSPNSRTEGQGTSRTLLDKISGQDRTESPHPLSSMSLRNKSSTSFKRLSRKSSASSIRSQSSSSGLKGEACTPDIVPPLPTNISSDRLSNLGIDTAKKKDPLWGAFRSIEGDFATFQSKTSLQRVKVLRTSLLPFLSKYAQHPSNTALRAEDLDRRVVILNKWWTGLLEMLTGRTNQSITGTDRPAFLEAAAQIMMRPEWRIPVFPSSATDTPRPPSINVTKSSTSLRSDESDFLVETVHQNVRNMFVQNLLGQMAFVVDKLSMRSAPASLVTFSGKACAYGFFFCPGVADILVRLWRIPAATLRRIFSEIGFERGEKLDLVSKGLTSRFPTPVRSLAVSTQANLIRTIQLTRQIPPGTENIQWHGPWLGRWSGRDSDLFFVFTKHFHILVTEFLLEEVTPKERLCVPGLAPVHAQVLTVLESTIHRQAGQSTLDNYSSPGSGGMENPDSYAPLPMSITNASRMITENRLVILLRDILSDRTTDYPLLRELYTTSFCDIVKAAARRISLYNNDACFVLCDFLEEVFPIMSRHYQSDTPFLDWPFWFKVCRQMAQSHNTLTQVRLIAFVYSAWTILIHNEERKKELVLGWLLDQHLFDQLFCHWSPMVRHYYFRLLCWRVGRCDGDPTPLDVQILETLAARLNRCWAHYQYLSAEAEMRDLCPPSTSPCSPAPSRCLVIIRTDNQALPPSAFSSFDKFLAQGLLNQTTPYQRSSSILNTIPNADAPTPGGSKKRWSLLKMLGPFASAPGNNRPGEVTPPQSPGEDGLPLGEKPISRPATPPHQAFSFRFSLEWIDSRQTLTDRNRKVHAPGIPPNAQKCLDDRRVSHSSSSAESKRSTRSGEVRPMKPVGRDLDAARYSGRALAEWSQVLTECKNFYIRRKQEGVPRDHLVETPTMGVETFRMAG